MLSTRTFILLGAIAGHAHADVRVEGKEIVVEFNNSLHSRVMAKWNGKEVAAGAVGPSEFLTVAGSDVQDFALAGQKRENVRDKIGTGRRWTITGNAPGLRKTVAVAVYDEFPGLAFFEVAYTNTGGSEIAVTAWTNNRYSIAAGTGAGEPAFWSYQSGSYKNRPDWVLPLKAGFEQANFMGMNSSDYGGGTPVSDVWRRDVGLGVGHVEMAPKLVSIPVAQPGADRATVAVSQKVEQKLAPGATLRTLRTFVSAHRGDYFATLESYRRVMQKQGIKFDPAPESAFQPIWCAWGYGRTFTPQQVYNALPVVKKLGFTWVGLDDGWQTNEGDWALLPAKFPNGDRDMKAMVDRFHEDKFRAQLWWAPLAADEPSEVYKQHPEWMLLNADGSKQRITYWNSWYMCPAEPGVIAHHRNLVVKMFRDWGYDGLKLDGQYMNAAPACYNKAHNHARPEEAIEAMPQFFKMIYDTARSIKPDALVEWCPCGTAFSFFTLPFLNMSVASDPRSSFQVRSKGKTLKALHGDQTAYFGDHVELSTGRDDFASTVGIGGVIGTEFTWPVGSTAAGARGVDAGKREVLREMDRDLQGQDAVARRICGQTLRHRVR